MMRDLIPARICWWPISGMSSTAGHWQNEGQAYHITSTLAGSVTLTCRSSLPQNTPSHGVTQTVQHRNTALLTIQELETSSVWQAIANGMRRLVCRMPRFGFPCQCQCVLSNDTRSNQFPPDAILCKCIRNMQT